MRREIGWIVTLVGIGLILMGGFTVVGTAMGDDTMHIGGSIIAIGVVIALIGVPVLLGGLSLLRHRANVTPPPGSGRLGWNCPHCGRVQVSDAWQCAACGTPRPGVV